MDGTSHHQRTEHGGSRPRPLRTMATMLFTRRERWSSAPHSRWRRRGMEEDRLTEPHRVPLLEHLAFAAFLPLRLGPIDHHFGRKMHCKMKGRFALRSPGRRFSLQQYGSYFFLTPTIHISGEPETLRQYASQTRQLYYERLWLALKAGDS